MLTRRRCRGAAALLALCLSLCTLTIGLATACGVVLAAGDERAGAAADAAAHGAEVALQAGPFGDALSVDLQAGRSCTDPMHLGPGSVDGMSAIACANAWLAADGIAATDGASLVELHVGPDLRDRAPGAGAGGFIVLAHVTVRRPLPGLGSLCAEGHPPDPAFCQAEAWSAAQGR